MTNQHPITPPPSLTDKWNNLPLSTEEIFVIAAQWGSDQELEACCEWLQDPDLNVDTYKLRAARRPKSLTLPLTLKDQALALLEIQHGIDVEDLAFLRRALETIHD